MDVPVLTEDAAVAAEKRDEYQVAAERFKDSEYAEAATIYAALADGHEVIDAGAAIREGGFDDKMRPRLAIARADRSQIGFYWHRWSDTARFDSRRQWDQASSNHWQLVEEVNFNRRNNKRESVSGFAMVPIVPAHLRSKKSMRQYHILWEVEEWSDSWIGTSPDRDPYLLERLTGDYFKVVGEWDLTDVERAVMSGRARVSQ